MSREEYKFVASRLTGHIEGIEISCDAREADRVIGSRLLGPTFAKGERDEPNNRKSRQPHQ